MSYQPYEITSEYLKKLSSQHSPYTKKNEGRDVMILPGAASSDYVAESSFHQRIMGDLTGKSVLEVGCCCGIIGIEAWYNGAGSVTMIDSNPEAVKNARLNVEKHGYPARVHCSDLFDQLPPAESDLIYFLTPFHVVG